MELTQNPELQNQPCGHSCVPTCIAMALDIPVDKVLKEMADLGLDVSKGTNDFYIMKYLVRHNIAVETFMNRGLGLGDGHYFFNVNSLNRMGLNHCVFVYIKNLEPKVYDPNNGKEGKKFYDIDDFTSMPSSRISRLIDFTIEE